MRLLLVTSKKTIEVSETLKREGFWVTPIRPPTVAVNSSRLRVTICADHSVIDINGLSESINKALA
jgi:8-amino-7-oxononanoate synthase